MTKWLPYGLDWILFPVPTLAKSVLEQYENARRAAQQPARVPIPVFDPETGETGQGYREDKGDYYLITYPDGTQEKKLKERGLGAQLDLFLDDHMTWGNLFKLGLVGLGAGIFLGGLKISRDVQK